MDSHLHKICADLMDWVRFNHRLRGGISLFRLADNNNKISDTAWVEL